jgi:N-methylhydantoinase B/oxoprolinase/acetone carboxylase alpha subunit
MGTVRTLEVTAPEVTLSALFDRAKIAPWGLFGGMPGGLSTLRVKRAGDTVFQTFSAAFGTVSPTKFTNVILRQGDIVTYQTPGGGGFGPPHERPADDVLQDVRSGWVSPESARQDYGVAITRRGRDVVVDEDETRRLREGHE